MEEAFYRFLNFIGFPVLILVVLFVAGIAWGVTVSCVKGVRDYLAYRRTLREHPNSPEAFRLTYSAHEAGAGISAVAVFLGVGIGVLTAVYCTAVVVFGETGFSDHYGCFGFALASIVLGAIAILPFLYFLAWLFENSDK